MKAFLFLSFHGGPESVPDPSSEKELYLREEQAIQPSYKPGEGIQMSQLLLNYKITTKDKIVLAYTIALAYWQLYGSDLTRAVWTSRSIWFMQESELGVMQDHTLPLKSYLTFNFGKQCVGKPNQPPIDLTPVHDFPEILSIGIILLEIALSRPFPDIPLDGALCINSRHQIAIKSLEALEKMKWDCFPSKWMFDAAVAECLNFRMPQAKKTPRGISMEEMAREQFYRKVVCRLAYLVKSGYKKTQAGRAEPKRQGEEKQMPPDACESRGDLHSGRRIVEKKWLENLKKICTEVEEKRCECQVSTSIKVAILDTGCDPSLLPGKPERHTVKWKDFTDANNQHPQDKCGHGSLMARFVLECAPSAEIIVARIAKDIDGLEQSQPKIAEVRHKRSFHSLHLFRHRILSQSHTLNYCHNIYTPVCDTA